MHGVSWWCRVKFQCVFVCRWVGQRVSHFHATMRELFLCATEVRADERRTRRAWLSTSASTSVYILLVLTFSPGEQHRRHAHTALMKMSLCCFKQWPSQGWLPAFFLFLTAPLPPPQQMEWGESQTLLFKSISSSPHTYELMKCQSFHTEVVLSKPAALKNFLFYCFSEEIGGGGVWRGRGERLKWKRAKVWLGLVSLPCVISDIQTAHHREGKKIGK